MYGLLNKKKIFKKTIFLINLKESEKILQLATQFPNEMNVVVVVVDVDSDIKNDLATLFFIFFFFFFCILLNSFPHFF